MSQRCVGCMKLKEQSPVCEHCGYNENVPNESHQLPIGTVLQGRYQVGKKLGQGGFGITYIGWDDALEAPIAIKEYYPNSFVNRDCGSSLSVSCSGSNVSDLFAHNRDRFLREARILAKLQNVPGIVRVQNLFSENNTAYIIMEYVEGIDLKQYIRMQGRVLTVEEVFSVLRPMIYALSKVHEAELVHRDISPDNIMILPDGSAKLLDFGAAREVENPDVNADLPQSTEAILKHGFAPMEQYRRRGSLGPWTDVYALCATIYYCLTGRVPNSAPERIMGDDNVNWRQIPGLNEQQIATLEKGLALLPENRIASMRELHQGLFGRGTTEYTGKQQTATPVQQAENYPSYTLPLETGHSGPGVMVTKKKRSPILPIAAGVLAVAALAGFLLLRPKQPETVPNVYVPETIEQPVIILPEAPVVVTQPAVTEPTSAPEVALDSPVMMDQDGIYVEFRGFEKYSTHSYVINLYIENNRDTDFCFSLENTMINDYLMTVANNGITVPAHSKYMTLPQFDLVVDADHLTDCNVTKVHSLRTTIEILTERNGTLICQAPVGLTIGEPGEEADPRAQGVELMNNEDFYVSFRSVADYSTHSKVLNLYVENKRDTEVYLKLKSHRLNDFTLDLSNNGVAIPAGGKYLSLPSFDFVIGKDKLEGFGITDIETVDFAIEFYTSRNGSLISSTPVHVDIP